MPTKRAKRAPATRRLRAARARAKGLESALDPGRAQTVIYIHGIGNKPPQDVLKCQWDHALFGFDLGERSRLAYWVDRAYHGPEEKATCTDGDKVTESAALAAASSGIGAQALAEMEVRMDLGREVSGISTDERSDDTLLKIAREMQEGAAQVSEHEVRARAVEAKILWLPKPIRSWITRRLTGLLLHDVEQFFYDKDRRRAMRDSLLERLRTGGGPFVVVGHSQGSMIAWDVLSDLDPADYEVDLFVTIGSPLGLTEVKDRMKLFRGTNKLRVPECVLAWQNFGDLLDPVCLDKSLKGEYAANSRGVQVSDHLVKNHDSPLHPHSGTGYLEHSAFVQRFDTRWTPAASNRSRVLRLRGIW